MKLNNMETNKEIQTAEEFFNNYMKGSISECMIEFAKLHLSKQAEVIAGKAKVDYISTHSAVIDRESILQASEEYINNLK